MQNTVNNDRKHKLCAVERRDLKHVVWIEEKVVHNLKLCRLEEHRAAIVRKRPVIVDSIVHVTLVYGNLSARHYTTLQVRYCCYSNSVLQCFKICIQSQSFYHVIHYAGHIYSVV